MLAGSCAAVFGAAFVLISLVNAWLFHVELSRVRDVIKTMTLPVDFKPILIPAYSRPEYLRQVLEAVTTADGFGEVCEHGSVLSDASWHCRRASLPTAQTVVVVSQDGSNEGIRDLIDEYSVSSGGRVVRMWHTQPYLNIPQRFYRTDAPTAANVKYLLTLAMEYLEASGAIVLESDIAPSPDFYRYFQWAGHHLARDPHLAQRVFTVNGFHHDSKASNDLFTMTADRYGFMVWGWLCPAHSWPLIRDNWTWYHNWDITMEYSIRRGVAGNEKVSLSPMVSRVRNIGMTGINFNIPDKATQRRWLDLHVPAGPVKYKDEAGNWKPMTIEPHPLGPQAGKQPAGTRETLQAIERVHEAP